jgi:hypothetical protein
MGIEIFLIIAVIGALIYTLFDDMGLLDKL